MTTQRVCTALLLALIGVGCSDPLGPPPDQIVGSWTSTGFEFISKEGLGRVDAAAQGYRADMTLAPDRTGSLVFTLPSTPGWSWVGPWEIDGDLFRLGGQGADIVLKSGTLRLTGFDALYDFDADTELDPAKMNLVLVRPGPARTTAPQS